MLDDAENFDAAKYFLQNTSSTSKFGKTETLLSLEYHVDKNIIDSEMIRRMRSRSSGNKNRLSSMSFNSNDCLDGRTGMNEEHDSGAQVTKFCYQSSNEGPIPEIIELCTESLKNRIRSYVFSYASDQVVMAFDELYASNKLPIYTSYNLYPKGSGSNYPIHRDANSVLASAVTTFEDSAMGLVTERNTNLLCAESGDIAWIGPNVLHLVSPVGTGSNRITIFIYF